MYNPDEDVVKKAFQKPKEKKPPEITPKEPPILMTQKEWLRHYIKECSHFREGYGFGMEKGKLVVRDKKRLECFDPETKEILREIYLELK